MLSGISTNNFTKFAIGAMAILSVNLAFAGTSLKKSDLEKVPLNELHPTQKNVGYFQAEKKQLPELEGIVSRCNIMKEYSGKDGYSTSDCYQHELKDYLKENYIPVVEYHHEYFLVDHHHLAYALDLLFNKVDGDPEVYINVVQTYPDSYSPTTVWDKMIENNQLWPYYYSKDENKYEKISDNSDNGNPFNSLPTNVTDLGNDPYRSIFGLARSLDPIKFEKPSLEQTNFYQFKWAACLLSASDSKYDTNVKDLASKSMPKAIYGAKIVLKDIASDGGSIMQQCQSANPKEFNNIPRPELKD
jgi:hypothetical protein